MPNLDTDPYLVPAFSLRNKLTRLAWGIVYSSLFRLSPRPFHGWRRFLLRRFGARIGCDVHIYPTAQIWAPWNLSCDDQATIGPDAIVYNPRSLHVGSHAIVSQQAYICGATHDYEDPAFPLIAFSMTLGPYSWVCARAAVQPGVNVGEGAVLGLGSVATRDLLPWTVYGGVPARRIKSRKAPNSEPAPSRRAAKAGSNLSVVENGKPCL
jgi:putative colanic acid biosynthesis acetyltransferase WcaF